MAQKASEVEEFLEGVILAMQKFLAEEEAHELPLGDSPLELEQKALHERSKAEIRSIMEMFQGRLTGISDAKPA